MEDDIASSMLNHTLVKEESYESADETNPSRFVYLNHVEPEIELVILAEQPILGNVQKSRGRQPDVPKQNFKKMKVKQGLEDDTISGEAIGQKEMGPPCTCTTECYSRLGNVACKKVYNNFWKLGDYCLQNAYIGGCVRISLPKQCSKNKINSTRSRRFFNRFFYVNVNGIDTEICKQAFLNLHSISNGRLNRLLKKKQEAGNTGIDARGRHSNQLNKVKKKYLAAQNKKLSAPVTET